jgi:hypothetical protein
MENLSFKLWLFEVERIIENNSPDDTQAYHDLVKSVSLMDSKPKVLYITGLQSKGVGPKLLEKLQFDVTWIPTSTNWTAAIGGRIKRYPVLNVLQKPINRIGSGHMASNVASHDEKIPNPNEINPDIVVASSQGGAVAMSLAEKYPSAKFVLIAPAWKIFNAPCCKIPSDSIIIHGKKDWKVPHQDSVELAKMNGAKLISTNDGHDDVSYSLIVTTVLQQWTALRNERKQKEQNSIKNNVLKQNAVSQINIQQQNNLTAS